MLECMQITFQCKSPDSAQELSFKGISAFDAAIHCAAVSAAERMTHQRKSSDLRGGRSASSSTSLGISGEPSTLQSLAPLASAPQADGSRTSDLDHSLPAEQDVPALQASIIVPDVSQRVDQASAAHRSSRRMGFDTAGPTIVPVETPRSLNAQSSSEAALCHANQNSGQGEVHELVGAVGGVGRLRTLLRRFLMAA